MTGDDDSAAAVKPPRRTRTSIEPKSVIGFAHSVPRETFDVNKAFQPGTSVGTLMILLHLPWICSVVIMAAAILVYFFVHPWPDAFTETTLGIIVGGTAVASGSRAISLFASKWM